MVAAAFCGFARSEGMELEGKALCADAISYTGVSGWRPATQVMLGDACVQLKYIAEVDK